GPRDGEGSASGGAESEIVKEREEPWDGCRAHQEGSDWPFERFSRAGRPCHSSTPPYYEGESNISCQRAISRRKPCSTAVTASAGGVVRSRARYRQVWRASR